MEKNGSNRPCLEMIRLLRSESEKSLFTRKGILFNRYRTELVTKRQLFFRASIHPYQKKHSLVSNFRLTQIDIVSTLMAINKKRNK